MKQAAVIVVQWSRGKEEAEPDWETGYCDEVKICLTTRFLLIISQTAACQFDSDTDYHQHTVRRRPFIGSDHLRDLSRVAFVFDKSFIAIPHLMANNCLSFLVMLYE